MLPKITKHSGNDASNDVHRTSLGRLNHFWDVQSVHLQVATVNDEASSDGGDEDQGSLSRKGSTAEFRQTSSSYNLTGSLSRLVSVHQ